MKEEYDFSKGLRGKFYHPEVALNTKKLKHKAQLDELLIQRLAKVSEAPIPIQDVQQNVLDSLKATPRLP